MARRSARQYNSSAFSSGVGVRRDDLNDVPRVYPGIHEMDGRPGEVGTTVVEGKEKAVVPAVIGQIASMDINDRRSGRLQHGWSKNRSPDNHGDVRLEV